MGGLEVSIRATYKVNGYVDFMFALCCVMGGVEGKQIKGFYVCADVE